MFIKKTKLFFNSFSYISMKVLNCVINQISVKEIETHIWCYMRSKAFLNHLQDLNEISGRTYS